MQEGRKPEQIKTEQVQELLQARPLTLVACIRNDAEHRLIIRELEQVLQEIGSYVDVFYVLDNLPANFIDHYHIKGTPTFLLLHRDRVIDMILGKSSSEHLISFISPHISQDREPPNKRSRACTAPEPESQAPFTPRIKRTG